jgi:hypothetical protein
MRKALIVTAVACLLTLSFLAGRASTRANFGTWTGNTQGYLAKAHCTNCGWDGEVRVPLGRKVSSLVCPNCAVRESRGGTSAETAGEGRTSTLITSDAWELRKTAAAGFLGRHR